VHVKVADRRLLHRPSLPLSVQRQLPATVVAVASPAVGGPARAVTIVIPTVRPAVAARTAVVISTITGSPPVAATVSFGVAVMMQAGGGAVMRVANVPIRTPRLSRG